MVHRDQLWTDGAVFYYADGLFPPGTDSFLLGAFAAPHAEDCVCDLGGGTGLLGVLLLARQPNLRLHHVELQSDAIALAERSFAENGWRAQVTLHGGDLRDGANLPPAGSCDYVLSNPPYFAQGSGIPSASASLRTARSEEGCSIEALCAAAARILRWGGRFAVVWKPERTVDLLCAMRQSGIEPKRLQWVQHRAESAPSLLLVEGRRGGRSGLTVLPPLVLYDSAGKPTPALNAAYFRL